jgi:hypothetical protein
MIEGSREWERRHPPSLRAWNSMLGSMGLKALRDPGRAQKAARTLPSMVGSEPAAWKDDALNWVSVVVDPGSDEPLHLYCRDCHQPPGAWIPAGTGWSSFDTLTGEFENARSKRAAKPSEMQRIRDPREIRY